MWTKNGFPDTLDNDRKVNTTIRNSEIRKGCSQRVERGTFLLSMEGKCAQRTRDNEHG